MSIVVGILKYSLGLQRMLRLFENSFGPLVCSEVSIIILVDVNLIEMRFIALALNRFGLFGGQF